MARDQGCTLSEPRRVVGSGTASTFARANSARSRGFQLAAVEADIAQGAVIELVDAGELGAIAKISPDGVEKKCSVHDPGFPLSMGMVRRRAIARIGQVN